MGTAATHTELIDAVTQHVDTVFERFSDCYGAEHTPLLADSLDLDTGTAGRWEGQVLSNPACQQNFLRAAVGLSALTGEGRHRDRAEAWIRCALERLQDPASDLLYWAGHSSYDLETGAPVKGNHEMKCVYPYYEFLHQVDADRTRRFVEALWHCHVSDWTTLLFNRHGEYEPWDRSTCWNAAEFAGGPLPIVGSSLLSFINTGSDLICAAGLLYQLEGDDAPWQWARRLVSRYEQVRHPDTGLAGYQFNHRDPCRVRIAFKPPLGQRQDVNETTVIKQGGIGTRYGSADIAFMNLADAMGTERDTDLLDLVRRDLTALAEYSYDPADHAFFAMLVDGTRLKPDDVEPDVGYCQPDGLEKLPANGLMFLAYAQAYRVFGDEAYLQVALGQARGMGWSGGADAAGMASPPEVVHGWRNAGQDDVSALHGWLQLYRASGDTTYLEVAVDLAARLRRDRCWKGVFTTGVKAGGGLMSPDSELPLALLHLAAALEQGEGNLPAYYPNLSYFDGKIVMSNRSR